MHLEKQRNEPGQSIEQQSEGMVKKACIQRRKLMLRAVATAGAHFLSFWRKRTSFSRRSIDCKSVSAQEDVTLYPVRIGHGRHLTPDYDWGFQSICFVGLGCETN